MKVYYSLTDIQPLYELCFLVAGSLMPDMVTPIFQAMEVISNSESPVYSPQGGYQT